MRTSLSELIDVCPQEIVLKKLVILKETILPAWPFCMSKGPFLFLHCIIMQSSSMLFGPPSPQNCKPNIQLYKEFGCFVIAADYKQTESWPTYPAQFLFRASFPAQSHSGWLGPSNLCSDLSRKFSRGLELQRDSILHPSSYWRVEPQSSQNEWLFGTLKLLVAKQTHKHADLHHDMKLRQI